MQIDLEREPDLSDATAPGGLAKRGRAFEGAVHSALMEGVIVTAATRRDAQEYVSGGINIDELIARVIARYPVVVL